MYNVGVQDNKPNISKTEWGLYIAANVVVDLIQIGLDVALQIGVVVNRFIDIFWGMACALYLHLRGQSMANPKRLFGLIATFVGEEIPDVDVLPFWTLDAIYIMSLAKSEALLKQVPGASNVVSIASGKKPQIIPKRNLNDGKILP